MTELIGFAGQSGVPTFGSTFLRLNEPFRNDPTPRKKNRSEGGEETAKSGGARMGPKRCP